MPKLFSKYLLAVLLGGATAAASADDYYGTPSSPRMGTAPAATSTATSKKPESYGAAIGNKLGTGFSNLVLSPLEIPKNVINTTNDVNLALGSTAGVIKGFLHMAGRFLAGTVDVVTFPLPTEPITTPQYVWDDYKIETRYNGLFKIKNTQ
jgi:putative exosortase-associated protein (TIGR04073 family)